MPSLKHKSFPEQYLEARKHTSIEAMRKKPYLARNCYDHLIVGGTPPNYMLDFPEKPEAEFRSDRELEALLDRTFDSITTPLPGSSQSREGLVLEVEARLRECLKNQDLRYPLVEELLYLSEIRRLPEKYRNYFPKDVTT